MLQTGVGTSLSEVTKHSWSTCWASSRRAGRNYQTGQAQVRPLVQERRLFRRDWVQRYPRPPRHFLIESVFSRSAYGQTLSFRAIAEKTRLPLHEAEHLVMKGLRYVW